MKKTLALILAIVMVFALAIPAMAVNAADGTITVKNAKIGQTYNLYKILDATYNADNDAISYSIDKDSAWYDAVSAEDSPFVLTTKSGTIYVTAKEGVTSKEIAEWAADVVEAGLPEAEIVDSIDAEANVIVFDGLKYGYYFVESSLGAVVSVTSVNINADVVDKNSDIGTDEENGGLKTIVENGALVEKNTATIGETVNFRIAFEAPRFLDGKLAKEYAVVDEWSAGFTMDKNSIKLTIDGEEVAINDLDFVQGEPENEYNNSFYFVIPWLDAEGNSLYSDYADVVVTYSGKLNDNAHFWDQTGSNNVNKATVIGYDTEGGESTVEDETNTETYCIVIYKCNPEGKVLDGAKFEITDANGNKIAVNKVENKSYFGNVYNADASAAEGSNVVVSDENGIIMVRGLKAGTYTFTEVDAPDGYNKLAAPVVIEAGKDTQVPVQGTIFTVGEKTVGYMYIDNHVGRLAAIELVINESGAELPETGGMGTTLFYIMGSLLVVGAAVVLYAKKRAGAEA